MLRTTRKPGDAPPGPLRNCFRSEGVFQAEEDSSVTAVGGSFIEEPGIGDARFGDAEVARIRQVEEVGAKLKPVAPGKQARRLRDTQVYVADTIRTQDVAAHVPEPVTGRTGQGRTNTGARREVAEERAATRLSNFLETHAGNRKVRVEIGSNGISHQGVDAAECCRRSRTVQRPEGRAALQGEDSTDLPAAQETAEGARLAAIQRQFVNGVDRESVRSIIGRAGTLRTPVERVLSQGHFSADGRVERVRRSVKERAPGVMRTGTEATVEPALHAELHGMIDRGGGVGAEREETGAGRDTRG